MFESKDTKYVAGTGGGDGWGGYGGFLKASFRSTAVKLISLLISSCLHLLAASIVNRTLFSSTIQQQIKGFLYIF